MGPLIDPLLESFADRYVEPWGSRELPIDLVPQLDDAAELFERGRQRWRTFDVLSKGGKPRALVERDFEGKEWAGKSVHAARSAHRFLLTSYNLSKPDELWLGDLRGSLKGAIPDAVLYASVAMRCAVDAADECCRFALVVEDYELRAAGKVKFSDLAGEVAEALECIATYLGAARTALALADASENAANLDQAERDYVELWEQHDAVKRALRVDRGRPVPIATSASFSVLPAGQLRNALPDLEAALAEKVVLKKENIELRAKSATRLDAANQKRQRQTQKIENLVCEAWKKDVRKYPDSKLVERYTRIQQEKIFSRYKNTKGEPMTDGGLRAILVRRGLLENKSRRDLRAKV